MSLGITSSQSSAQSFIDSTGVNTPLTLIDTNFRVASNYGVTGTPTWLLFDGSGNQLDRGSRINSLLENAVNAALGR